jgi:hypothetical protein
MQVEPAVFYRPEALLRETKARIEKVGRLHKNIHDRKTYYRTV